MIPISAHNLNPVEKLPKFPMSDKEMDIIPEHQSCYTTQYKEAFLKDMENEYCARDQLVPVDKPENISSSNLVPSLMAL